MTAIATEHALHLPVARERKRGSDGRGFAACSCVLPGLVLLANRIGEVAHRVSRPFEKRKMKKQFSNFLSIAPKYDVALRLLPHPAHPRYVCEKEK